MPNVIPNQDGWLSAQIAQLKRDVATLKAQQTQYVVDASGTTQAIIGNLSQDPHGNATGLSGFGTADLVGGVWMRADVSGAGTSPFLQLASIQRLEMQTGTVAVTWAGASNLSGTVTVTFPVAYPSAVVSLFVCVALSTGGTVGFANASALTLTGFSVVASDPFGIPGAGVQATVSWLALGN